MGVRRQFFPFGITMMRRDARRSERFFRASLFICSCPGCNPGHRLSGRGLCSPPPAKAYGFVSGSKKFTEGGGGKRLIAGSPTGAFAPRRPQRHTASFRGAKSSQRTAAEIVLLPACRPPPLLPAACKGLRFRFGEQKVHRGRRRKTLNRRLAGRRLCSPPPAKAYGFVSGSKKFTEGGGGKRLIAGCRPPPLLPAACKGLRLRFGEQKVHTERRRKTLNCRLAGRRLCSPPPAKAYGFVSGSKKFTQGGGGKRLIDGVPAAAFAPRRPQRLTDSFRGAKSSQRAAAENA